LDCVELPEDVEKMIKEKAKLERLKGYHAQYYPAVAVLAAFLAIGCTALIAQNSPDIHVYINGTDIAKSYVTGDGCISTIITAFAVMILIITIAACFKVKYDIKKNTNEIEVQAQKVYKLEYLIAHPEFEGGDKEKTSKRASDEEETDVKEEDK